MPKLPRSTKSKATVEDRFEVFLGGAWQAFRGKVTTRGQKVTIVREVKPEDEPAFMLTTVFNLDQLPAYSFA